MITFTLTARMIASYHPATFCHHHWETTTFRVSFSRYEDMSKAIETQDEKISIAVKKSVPTKISFGYASFIHQWNIWDHFECHYLEKLQEAEWQRKCLLNL